MIVINDLYKSFDGDHVLSGVNLEILDGETLIIIGRSGCGKSVFLKHIVGLLKPDSGSVIVDDLDITRIDYKMLCEVRQRFGVVFQSAALFDSYTVRENVGMALRRFSGWPVEKIDQKIQWSLEAVDLNGVEEKYPSELSGGMKKRVGIARAIVMDPSFLLFDEPTTGVDPITADEINRLIMDLQKKLSVTSVIVTHDLDSAFQVGDRVAMLYDGKIQWIGTPEEIKRTKDPRIREFIVGRISKK